MRKNGIFVAFATLALCGTLSIFTLPFRERYEMPETGLKTEACTLDEEIARKESEAQKRKKYLDSLLESAKMEAQTLEIVMEAREIVTECAETESEYISMPETETTEIEAISEAETETETETAFIFHPVDSMMAADLQAWVYAYTKDMNIDPYIVMAICERESCCIANIYGDNGRAYGIMQVQIQWIPEKLAAHGYTAEDMLQAQPNIIIGTEILSDYIATGNGLEWALMAYNGGAQAAGSPETREYAAWIIARANELRRQNA